VFVLKWLPVRKEVLIEGKYDHEELGGTSLFKTNRLVFCFNEYCKECLEEWRRTGREPETLYQICTVGIPRRFVLNLSQMIPQRGDIVKIIGWKNIFGRVVAYQIESSDFVYVGSHDESYRLEALAAGFSDVEKYRKVQEQKYREKCIVELMKEENLTKEEAEIFEVFGFFETRDREAKRLDKSISELDEAMHNNLIGAKYCYEIDGRYLAKIYLRERSLDPEVRAHLNKCSDCNTEFMVSLHGSTDEDREKIDAELNLRSCLEIDAEELGITVEELQERRKKNMTLRWGHGEGCFTMKERIAWARYEDLSAERLVHMESCLGCQRMLKADREDFLQTGKIGTLKMKEWRESKSKETTTV